MPSVRPALLMLLLAAAAPALADDELPGRSGPVAKAVRAVGEKGLSPGVTAAGGATKFTPSGRRRIVDAWVKASASSPEEASGLRALVEGTLEAYETAAAAGGFASDVAGAMAFAVGALHSVSRGSEVPDAAVLAMVGQWRAALDVPSVRDATDAERQEFYESIVATAGVILGLNEAAAGQAEAIAKIRASAAAALEGILGVPASSLSIGEKGLTIPPKAPEAKPKADGLAPGFTFAPPAGWTRTGEWHVTRKVENRGGGDEITSAMFRFLPAIPAQGNMGDALRKVWEEATPKGLSSKFAPLVYRRFVGAGAFAQFLYGLGREEGRLSDSAFTVYLVDCGAWWQPVVQAQIYEEPGSQFVSGIAMSAQYALPTSAAMAESMLETFRVAGERPRSVVDEPSLVGIWVYGTSNAMQWVHSVTGAYAGMTTVSYANWMDLRADGTLRFYHQGASGAVGALKFTTQEETGRWRVEGDLLVLDVAAPEGRVRKHRVVGLNHFGEGKRILSLLYLPSQPPTNLHCVGSDSYASTDTFGPPK